MNIWKIELQRANTQLIKMPKDSEIMDIQMQNGKFVMWFLSNPLNKEIEVKIDMYGTGWKINENTSKNEYLSTVQDGDYVWHFFMNYEE
jgi:hypothetical protein